MGKRVGSRKLHENRVAFPFEEIGIRFDLVDADVVRDEDQNVSLRQAVQRNLWRLIYLGCRKQRCLAAAFKNDRLFIFVSHGMAVLFL